MLKIHASVRDGIVAHARRDHPDEACGIVAGPEGMVVVRLWLDTCDAMGANAVNSLCEALGPQVADLVGGRLGLRILSNLCDRSLVTATCTLPVAEGHISGLELRERLVNAVGSQLWEQWLREYLDWDEVQSKSFSLPLATVAICTRDRRDDLKRCLDALMHLPNDGQEI